MAVRNTLRVLVTQGDIDQIATNTTSIDNTGSSEFTQSSHGLAVMDAIRHNGSAWVKALADAEANTATHVVTDVSGNDFRVASNMIIRAESHGLSLAQRYLSSSSAGALVTSAPSVAQPILRPVDANTISIDIQRATSASAVDNETFRADQVYMNMVNKSGGTLAKGIIVRHEDGTVTGVQACSATTGKAAIGVTLASSADDAAVQVAYGGKVQVLVKSGQNISEGAVFKPQADGKAQSGGGSNATGYLLEDGDLSADGGDELFWASMVIGEQG